MKDNFVSNLDFDDAVKSLRSYLESQEQFKDYDFRGSNISILLDILSKNTFKNSFYTNMLFSEMFLDSAQKFSSVASHSKPLNYLPRSVRSAKAFVDVELDVSGNPPFVVIPAGTEFRAKYQNENFTFQTIESRVVIPSNNRYCASNVEIYQGKSVTEYRNSNGDLEQSFPINSDNVDTTTISVNVRESADPNSESELYSYTSSIFGIGRSDPVFYLDVDTSTEKYEISFGRDIFGKTPNNGNVIGISYLVSKGDKANGASSFTAVGDISGYSAKVTSKKSASGGAARESIESVKYFAPKAAQAQERCVTERDYETLLRREFPEIKSITVDGGETLDPPKYGTVVISIDTGTGTLSQAKKRSYINFLEGRSVLTVRPEIVSPDYFYLSVTSEVMYDVKKTDKSSDDIYGAVANSIEEYSRNNLEDFKRVFRYSKFSSKIDSADEHIVSNATEVLPYIIIRPAIGQKSNHTIRFDNELTEIVSSTFEYNGNIVFLSSQTDGKLNISRTDSGSVTRVKSNIGSVDWQTGVVKIDNIIVDRLIDNGIKVYGRTKSRDINTPKSRIMLINSGDVSIRVNQTQ